MLLKKKLLTFFFSDSFWSPNRNDFLFSPDSENPDDLFGEFFIFPERRFIRKSEFPFRFYAVLNLRKLFGVAGVDAQLYKSTRALFDFHLHEQEKIWHKKLGSQWPMLSMRRTFYSASWFGGGLYGLYAETFCTNFLKFNRKRRWPARRYNDGRRRKRKFSFNKLGRRYVFRGEGTKQASTAFIEYLDEKTWKNFFRSPFLPYIDVPTSQKILLGTRAATEKILLVESPTGFHAFEKQLNYSLGQNYQTLFNNYRVTHLHSHYSFGVMQQFFLKQQSRILCDIQDSVSMWKYKKFFFTSRLITSLHKLLNNAEIYCGNLTGFLPYCRSASFWSIYQEEKEAFAQIRWASLPRCLYLMPHSFQLKRTLAASLFFRFFENPLFASDRRMYYNELVTKSLFKHFLEVFLEGAEEFRPVKHKLRKPKANYKFKRKFKRKGTSLSIKKTNLNGTRRDSDGFRLIISVFNRKMQLVFADHERKAFFFFSKKSPFAPFLKKLLTFGSSLYSERYEQYNLIHYNRSLKEMYQRKVYSECGILQTNSASSEWLLQLPKAQFFCTTPPFFFTFTPTSNYSFIHYVAHGEGLYMLDEGCNERVFLDDNVFGWIARGLSPAHSLFFSFLSPANASFMKRALPPTISLLKPRPHKEIELFPLILNHTLEDSIFDNFSNTLLSFSSRQKSSNENLDVYKTRFHATSANFTLLSFFEFPSTGASFFFNHLDGMRVRTELLSASVEVLGDADFKENYASLGVSLFWATLDQNWRGSFFLNERRCSWLWRTDLRNDMAHFFLFS